MAFTGVYLKMFINTVKITGKIIYDKRIMKDTVKLLANRLKQKKYRTMIPNIRDEMNETYKTSKDINFKKFIQSYTAY